MRRFIGSIILLCTTALWAVAFCTVTLFTASCGFSSKPPSDATTDITTLLPKPLRAFSASSPSITIMTWNVENLYDALDDPKKLDDSYLPLDLKKKIPNHFKECKKLSAKSWQAQCSDWDWNDEVVNVKLRKLAEVILAVDSGNGPDFLALQEIENIQMLQRLIDEHLPNKNYKAFLIENNDVRGIDVGVITRLPVLEKPKLFALGGSRPALQLTVELPDKNKLSVSVVHFPIATSPFEKRLQKLRALTAAEADGLQILLGDFNFPRHEMDDNNIALVELLPRWVPVHLYCTACLGSTYENYTQSWSFLDMILINQNFFSATAPWTVDVDSFKLHNPVSFQTNRYGSPADFELPWLSGVSDHWPLLIRLVKTH